MSVLTGSANFFKYLLFVVNFFFVITGIILISIGAAIQGVYHGYKDFLVENFFSVPNLLIAIGIIIFIIAFFGCCGAVKENYCMITTFLALLIIIFIMELAAGISGYVLRNEAKGLIEKTLLDSMDKFTNPKDEYIAIIWNKVQTGFQCCGVHNYSDWTDKKIDIPLSCCKLPSNANITFNCTTNEIYKASCLDEFGNYIKAHAVSLGAGGLVLALFQLIGVFITFFILRKLKLTTAHSNF